MTSHESGSVPENGKGISPFNWFKRSRKAEEADKQLLAQFYNTMSAAFLSLSPNETDPHETTRDTVRRKLDVSPEQRTWEQAYYIEQLMISLYDRGMLDTELNRRLVEAEKTLTPGLHSYYKAESQDGDQTLEGRQSLFRRLVNDLQWRYSIRQVTRLYANRARRNAAVLFLLALSAFIGLNLIPVAKPVLAPLFPTFYLLLNSLKEYFIITALLAGFIGSAFSILSGLKAQLLQCDLDTMKEVCKFKFMFKRAVVGMGAALILFYFFQAGIVQGTVFPDFSIEKSHPVLKKGVEQICYKHLSEKIGSVKTKKLIDLFNNAMIERQLGYPMDRGDWDNAVYEIINGADEVEEGVKQVLVSELKGLLEKNYFALNHKMYALLIVWCFLAGFSEKLVLTLLSKTEAQFNTHGHAAKGKNDGA